MNRLLGSAAAVGTLGWSVLAFAAETAENGAGDQASGGMPQLDPSTFGSQIFWLAVTFTGLYWLLSTKVLPVVEATIDERNSRIQGDLDAAAKLRGEAEAAYASYEAQLSAATTKAQETVVTAKEKVSTSVAEKTAELQAGLDKRIDDRVAELMASSQATLKNIDQVAVEVSQAAVERLIGVKVSADEAKAAVAAVK